LNFTAVNFRETSSKPVKEILSYPFPAKSYVLTSDSLYVYNDDIKGWEQIPINFPNKSNQLENSAPELWSLDFLDGERACVSGVYIRNTGEREIERELLLCTDNINKKQPKWEEPKEKNIPKANQLHITNLKFVDNRFGWLVGTEGTIWFTRDGGEKWSSQSSGTSNPLLSVFGINENTAIACGFNGTILRIKQGTGATKVFPEKPSNPRLDFEIGETVLIKPEVLRKHINYDGELLVKIVDIYKVGWLQVALDMKVPESLRIRLEQFLEKGLAFDEVEKIEVKPSRNPDYKTRLINEGGETPAWEKIPVPSLKDKTVTLRNVKFSPDKSTGWIVGDSGTILYLEKDKKEWQSLKIPPAQLQKLKTTQAALDFYSIFIDENYCWIAGSKGVIVRIKYK
jgi:hypothetical protein